MDGLDAFLGEWKLIVERSRFDHGPALKTSTLLLEDLGDALLVLVVFTVVGGRPLRIERELSYDGPTLIDDTEVTLQLAEDGALETIVREQGAEVARARRVLLEDGCLEVTQRGVTVEGEAFENVSVFRRVE